MVFQLDSPELNIDYQNLAVSVVEIYAKHIFLCINSEETSQILLKVTTCMSVNDRLLKKIYFYVEKQFPISKFN
jgi:hypothetical protein